MTLSAGEVFRERLAFLRKARGLTQHELERRIGKLQTEDGYISRIETGAIGTPPFDVVDKIAQELDIDVFELFFGPGLNDNPEQLRERISKLVASLDVTQLRKIYRMILVSLEKYSK